MRTSVIVPCAQKHVQHLQGLITALERQTVKPDEISIACSECAEVAPELRDKKSVIVQTNAHPALAGENRNRAAEKTKSHVLIYQDADDIPHPQRVEIIKTIFEKFEVDHLLHWFESLTASSSTTAWERNRYNVEHVARDAYYEKYGKTGTYPFHNGNNATSRAVFRRVRWREDLSRGQDVAYNKHVAYHFGATMARLPWPLVAYRQYLSTDRKG